MVGLNVRRQAIATVKSKIDEPTSIMNSDATSFSRSKGI